MLEFVDLVTPKDNRVHSLCFGGNNTRLHSLLRTVGDIPHGTEWRPRTAADRDALVKFLQSIDYSRLIRE